MNLWFAARELYLPIVEATGGWIQPALQVCAPSLVMYLLFFRLGGLRARDVGLSAKGLGHGIFATLLLWLACNGVALIAANGDYQLSATLVETPAIPVGSLLAQVFGNALWEETVYRGFFLVQLMRYFRAKELSSRRSVIFAILLSSLAFAVPHIPNRMQYDPYDGVWELLADQLRLVLVGCFLACVYLRTKNLWWLIGMHSLANAPTLLVEWDGLVTPKLLVSSCGTVLTIVWPLGRRRSSTDPP